MAPGALQRIQFGLSGSDATKHAEDRLVLQPMCLGAGPKEDHFALAWLSRWPVMAGSLTGLDNSSRAFDLPQGPVLHTMTPHYYWHAQPGHGMSASSRVPAREARRA